MRQVLVVRTMYKQTWTKSELKRKKRKHFNFNCNILLLRNTPIKSKNKKGMVHLWSHGRTTFISSGQDTKNT